MLIIPVLTVIAFILHPDGLTWIILNLLTTSVVKTHQRLGFPLCMFWCLVVWSSFILARRRRSADDSADNRDKHHARSSSEHAGSRSGRKGRKKGHAHNTTAAAASTSSSVKKSTAHDARNSTTSNGSNGSNAKRSSSRNDADMVMPLYDTSNSMQQQQYEHDEHHNDHSASSSSSSSSDGDSSHSDSDNDADDIADTPCQNDSHSGSTSTAAAAAVTNTTTDVIGSDTNTAVNSTTEIASADAANAKVASRATLASSNKPLSQRSNSLPSVISKGDTVGRSTTAHSYQSKQQYSSTLQQQQYQHRSRPTYQKQSFAHRADTHQKYRHNSDGNVNVHRQQHQYHLKAANNVSQRSPIRPLHSSRPYNAVRSQQWHSSSANNSNNITATSASPRTPVRSTDTTTTTGSAAATRGTATLDGRSYKAVSSSQSAINTAAAAAGVAVGTSVAECMQTCSLEQLLLYGGLDSQMSNRLATVCNGDAALLLQLVEADYAMLQVSCSYVSCVYIMHGKCTL
jgi:hypothetical protein